MASQIEQKFLGKIAKNVEAENPLLASMLYKILGLSLNLSEQTIKGRRQRRLDTSRATPSLDLYFHIIWLAREGLVMLDQYVIPMVGNHTELRVLAFGLRASFYHVFVLFHNRPAVSTAGISTPDVGVWSANQTPQRLDKGKGVARDDPIDTAHSSLQPTHTLEGGPVGPPPGFAPEAPASFLLPAFDYLPTASEAFKKAVSAAEELLWGSHSLRLAVKTEYSSFLYECLHDYQGSRDVAKKAISEVYEATEGIDNDMFQDACDLVSVLGKMMKRGLGSKDGQAASKNPGSASGSQSTPRMETSGPATTQQAPTNSMEGFI